MTIDQLTEENNRRREKLTPQNRTYYEDLMVYVRTTALFKREVDVETILLDILNDVLEAQGHGQSAEEYFGKNPKESADEIVRELPRSLSENLKLAMTVVLGYVLFFLLPTLAVPGVPVDFGNIISLAAFAFVFVMVIMWVISRTVYQKTVVKVIVGIAVFVAFTGIVVGGVFIKTPLSFILSPTAGIGLILLLFSITSYLFFKVFKHRMPWTILYIFVSIDAVIGIVSRLPVIGEFVTRPILSKSVAPWVLIPLLILVLLGSGFGTYYWLKKHDK